MKFLACMLAIAAACWSFPAGVHAADHSSRVAAESRSAAETSGKTEGMVRKVDKAAGKVTIRHEPIEHLGMPKMTMIFRVRDPAMLERLKEGDRILFVADRVDGKFTVTEFEPAE